MSNQINGIAHSAMQAPIIFWTDDYIYCGYDIDPVWNLWKRTYIRWNKYCRVMRILDVSGKCFVINRFEEVPARSSIGSFFRQKYWKTWVTPIIVSERQLSLDEFKKEVLRAVRARHQYDLDSRITEQTMENLPLATTYLEAIESLPKPL